jgi:DNA-binding NtrC family response regulator
MVEILTQTLTTSRFQVKGFDLATDALNSLLEDTSQIVLTDIQMTGMNGLKLLKEVTNR